MRSSLVARSKRIYLTGFMGSGKSTIGPILANSIGYDFADVDHEIEEKERKAVSEIFRDQGEAYFRALEREIIRDISSNDHMVISLGGGTLVDPENFRVISTTGIVVYLKTEPEQLLRRLHNKHNRPLMFDETIGTRLNSVDLMKRIRQIYSQREPYYEKADFTVQTDGTRVGITVDQIMKRISPYLES
jgi:shikimate kinase